MDNEPDATPADPTASLIKPLQDAVALFEELGIAYAVVGGIAAMVYGRARWTEDGHRCSSSGG